MDNALLLYIKKIIYSLREMESVYTDIDYIKEAVADIKLTVEDIYTGNQLSEWIDDLESFGSGSTTYRDATRMNTLITNYEACSNTAIDNHLFNWALANNKLGTFIGTALDNTSVSWSNLTTPNSIAANSTAFNAMSKDSRIFGLYFENSTCKQCIWNNRSKVKSGLLNAQNYLLTKASSAQTRDDARNIQWYVINMTTDKGGNDSSGGWNYVVYDTSEKKQIWMWDNNQTHAVNEFISSHYEDTYCYAHGTIRYINFG